MSGAWHRTGSDGTGGALHFSLVDPSHAAKKPWPVPGTTHVPFGPGYNEEIKKLMRAASRPYGLCPCGRL